MLLCNWVCHFLEILPLATHPLDANSRNIDQQSIQRSTHGGCWMYIPCLVFGLRSSSQKGIPAYHFHDHYFNLCHQHPRGCLGRAFSIQQGPSLHLPTWTSLCMYAGSSSPLVRTFMRPSVIQHSLLLKLSPQIHPYIAKK